MTPKSRRWAIVLGAGDGTRLHTLTGRAGTPVPKQFCTLDGGPSLLDLALERAGRATDPGSTITVVAARHRPWWSLDLSLQRTCDVVVQPANRGTATGVLLPLLELHRRDPRGSVVLLPSDHWVDDEPVLTRAVLAAFDAVQRDPRRIVLLGIAPDLPEPDYGWIVPGAPQPMSRGLPLLAVRTFVEKPPAGDAIELRRRGGLWNSFLIVAAVDALLGLYARRLPDLLDLLSVALDDDGSLGLAAVYASLDDRDFSRDLMQGAESELAVLRVPPCGWTDLGTPQRVAACVRRLRGRATGPEAPLDVAGRVNLASMLEIRL